jgi:polysaccharide export outer membrane protein
MIRFQKLKLKVFILLFVTLFPFQGIEQIQAQSTAYRIGPRDVLTLTIYAGGEKQQVAQLTVSSKGMINIPFVGSVHAAGLTIPQLVDVVTKPLAEDYFVNPEINIVISEYHSLQYYISGAIASAGLYEMKSEVTLLELIAKAGGVSSNHGHVAYILHPSANHIEPEQKNKNLFSVKDPLKIDLKKLLDKGDMSQNIVLKSGDVVYIPLQASRK